LVTNVPQNASSRELKERLEDKAREAGVSPVLICHVVAGVGRPGYAFFTLRDLFDNEVTL
jgi:hypothetical protein